ncbi:hypothetical protein [Candidatus Entotheonella palauensis]|uniref:Uncharacterized protein n=1 Tax=Candidatus Entotheonella gemina TaxID=1429439 RepID=W4MCX5_9BACT|nr:hypothetical protein [Candidatus Entotheonella palauensis]ETX08058.1 MAG: hypothetical protein ETSY2_07590 [Candidatus Entotheonella gemina]
MKQTIAPKTTRVGMLAQYCFLMASVPQRYLLMVQMPFCLAPYLSHFALA